MSEINNTITMLQAIERIPQPATSLRDMFFPRTITFPTEEVDLDYRKGGKRIAPYVTDYNGRGVNVAREGFVNKKYLPPMVAPQRPLTARDLMQRGIGEGLYSTKTPAQRAAETRARDLVDLRNMDIRREEEQVASFLINRSVTIEGFVDDGKNAVVNVITFDGDGKTTLTVPWDDVNANIYGDIMEGREFVMSSAPDAAKIVAICAPNVGRMMLENAKFRAMLDVRHMTVGNFTPRVTGMPGLDYLGTLIGMEIYTYSAQYEDFKDGQMKKYIPDNYFIIGSMGLGRRLYGAITQLEGPENWQTYEGMYVPKYWADLGGDVQMLRVASRHIIAPEDGNDFYTIKVK